MESKGISQARQEQPATVSHHTVSCDFELPFLICVPEKLDVEPIKISVPDIPFEPTKVESATQWNDWASVFGECKEATIVIWFPGKNSPIASRPWRETEQGEKYVGACGIHMECSIPESILQGLDRDNCHVPDSIVVSVFHQMIERLIISIRWRTGQYWLGCTPHVFGTRFETVWKLPEGKSLSRCSGSNRVLPHWSDSEPVKYLQQQEWREVERDLQSQEPPSLHEVFLWDARHALDGDDSIRAVLYAAIGMEIFTKQFYERKAGKKDPLYPWLVKWDRDVKVPVVEYYDSIASCMSGRSFKQEEPNAFSWVERLFGARNKIMHEGSGYFRTSGRGQKNELNMWNVGEMIKATKKAVDWLSQF